MTGFEGARTLTIVLADDVAARFEDAVRGAIATGLDEDAARCWVVAYALDCYALDCAADAQLTGTTCQHARDYSSAGGASRRRVR
jgi:hypothetical protein